MYRSSGSTSGLAGNSPLATFVCGLSQLVRIVGLKHPYLYPAGSRSGKLSERMSGQAR